MTGLISINGQVLPAGEAKISALDRGLLFGDNVFEVLVGFESQILDIDRHLNRLRQSAESILLEIPWSNEQLAFELNALAEQVPGAKKYYRLLVTRGDGLGLKIPVNAQPQRLVYCFPASPEPDDIYREGLSLKRIVRPYCERGAQPKTGNYLRSILALKRAEAVAQDILWTNSEGEIMEASAANIFFMGRDGDSVQFYTPPATCGILMGITRDTMLTLLRQAKIPASEQIIFADELPRFDEAFLCSTIRGLVPIRSIDGHKLHSARPSSVFRHIERLFNTWVETQLGFRVDWRTGEKLASKNA